MVKEGVSPDMAKHMEREKEKVMNILEKERGKGKGSRIITVLVWEAVISPNPRDMVKVDKARVRGSMAVVKERESEHWKEKVDMAKVKKMTVKDMGREVKVREEKVREVKVREVIRIMMTMTMTTL
jgi:hypothetical protein